MNPTSLIANLMRGFDLPSNFIQLNSMAVALISDCKTCDIIRFKEFMYYLSSYHYFYATQPAFAAVQLNSACVPTNSGLEMQLGSSGHGTKKKSVCMISLYCADESA